MNNFVYLRKTIFAKIFAMLKISATILTFNEERRIEACLQSLRDIADEIIVVDSFSTDTTLDICRRYGCRITQRRLAGFGAQRQYATSLTSHSYVLAIDADEILSPALRQSLLKLKQTQPSHRVYAIERLNFYCGYAVKHCGWSPDTQIRLFDKRYANWNLRNTQERVIFRDSVSPELLEGEILHNRAETAAHYAESLRRQSAVRALALSAESNSISPISPTLRAAHSFLTTYIANGGWLDGAVGFAIARHDARATRSAYSEARRIIREKNM